MQVARLSFRLSTVILPVALALVSVSVASATPLQARPDATSSPSATLVLQTSSLTPAIGASITLSAALTVSNSAQPSTGQYSIYDGGTALVSGAMANFQTGYAFAISTLSAGTHSITAKYVGSFNGLTATSNAVVVQVSAYSLILTSSPLPGGKVGANYSAAVNATGTVTQTTSTYNYAWTVNGVAVPANGTPYTLPGGISFTNTGGWTLSIGGKPTVAGTVPLTLDVTACTPSSSGCQLTSITSGPVSFSISVTSATTVTLPAPSANTPGPANLNQSYAGFINASGGGPNYNWTVNGTAVPIAGTHVPLTNGHGLYAYNTGGFTLSIAGTPTALGTVTFTAVAKDTASGVSSSPQTYSIAVNSTALHIVNGGIQTVNCGQPLAGATVTINTIPAKTTTTDANGAYSLYDIPNGTYKVTPSLSAPSIDFYPANQTTVVNGADTDVNFQAALGYTVSGTVNYNGTRTGRVYVTLYSNTCSGGMNPGTSIAGPGAFTIHGVAPGSYQLNAWMDVLGKGAPNGNDPSSLVLGNASVTVSTASVTTAAVTIKDPPAASLTAAPVLQGAAGFNQGAVVFYKAITNSKGIELPTSYTLQWSTSSSFAPITGSQSFPAIGPDATNIWIVNGAGLASGTGLVNGTKYYFRAVGVAGASTSPTSTVLGPITIGAATTGNKITGQVTFTGTAKGPLYTGFYGNGGMYVTQIGTKTNPPTSPANYTVYVPTGSGYFFFGILDQNNNGVVDPGDIQNTGDNNASTVSINGPKGLNLTLPAVNSSATVKTQHSRQLDGSGPNDNYSLVFDVAEGDKLPVAVTLASGANALTPSDVGICTDCGNHPYNFWLSLGSVAPTVGSAYGIKVTYADGTSETLSPTVSAVLNAFAILSSPTGTGIGSKPGFSWTDPANASSYTYQFSLQSQNSNGNIWQIPSNNSNYNTFPSTITSLTWDVDPLANDNGASLPSVSSLANGTYNWQIEAMDSNLNSSSMNATFTVGSGSGLSLPSPNPTSLPAAVVGHSYSGAINASGGPGGGNYTWTVNGIGVPTNNTVVNISADGLMAANSGGNTLFLSGTPTSAKNISLSVTVKDTKNETASQTYSVSAMNLTPVSLPASASASALVGFPFSDSLSASGGMSPWTWSINGTTVSSTGTPFVLADGLTASSNGGNSLTIDGTPLSPELVSILNVKVKDGSGATAGPVTYYVNAVAGPTGAHNAFLSGRYVCKTEGYNDSDGASWASLASFKADGLGNLVSGTSAFDMNANNQSQSVSGTLSGSYSVGENNNGLMEITAVETAGGTGTHTSKYAIALNNLAGPTASELRMVEIDDVGSSPSGRHSTSVCYQATTSAFVPATISGHSFAFGMHGVDESGLPEAWVGRFSASNGSVTLGVSDGMYLKKTVNGGGTFTGTYTAPDSVTGRFTMSTPLTGTAFTAKKSIYIIDADRAFVLMTSGDGGMQVGDMRTQQQTANNAATLLNGPFVLYAQGHEFNYNNDSVSGYHAMTFRAKGNGAGSATVNQSYEDSDGVYQPGSANGQTVAFTFDSTYPGRATFSPGTDSAFLYFFNRNTAFYLDLNGAKGFLETGWAEGQTQTTFTDQTLLGNYMLGQMPLLARGSNGNVGEFAPDANGNITGAITTAGQGDFAWNQSSSMTYSWDASAPGTGSLLIGSGSKGASCIVISATKFVCIENGSVDPAVMILQK